MKALIASAMFLLLAQSAFAASEVTQTQSDNSITNDTSYPSVSAKAKTTYSNEGGFTISRIAPVIGLIDSTVVGDGTSGLSSQVGLAVGGLIDIGHSDTVLETGLLYRQLGASASVIGITANLNLNYIAAPIGAKYYFSGQENSSVFLKGGIMPQFIVSKSVTALGQTEDAQGVATFDFDLYAGVGGKIAMSEGTDFVIDATYSRGLTNLDSSGSGSSSVFNSAFGLTAGVAFAL